MRMVSLASSNTTPSSCIILVVSARRRGVQRGNLLLLVLLFGSRAPAADDWPRYAHDPALTARSSLKGDIIKPREAWTYSAAGREVLIQLTPASGEHELVPGGVPAATSPADSSVRSAAAPEPLRLDVDDTGVLRPVVETFHERWARILPAVKGLQRIAWSHTWTDQKICRLQLFAYDRGYDKPRMVWQSDPPEDTIFNPLDVICDVDGDGVHEICVAAHHRVMVFDGATGRKETELRYHHSRPYGWFGLFDLDGDGRREFITIGDFQSHIDVLTYDPGRPEKDRLAVRWRRDIEPNIDERRKWPQVGPRPVVDVTGDGRPEIVLNLYNDAGDGEWHVVVLDAMTGDTRHDLPKRFMLGSADVDADAAEELFVMGTDGLLVPSFGRAEIVKSDGAAMVVVRAFEMSAFGAADLPRLGPDWSTTATGGMRHVLTALGPVNPRPFFTMLSRDPAEPPPFSTAVEALQFPEGPAAWAHWRAASLPERIELTALRAGAGGEVSAWVRGRLPAGAKALATGRAVRPQIIEDRPVGVTPSTPVAARLRAGGPMVVVVEGAAQTLHAIEPPASSDVPRLLWQRPGRGMSDGGRALGPMTVDLDGDGGAEVPAAAQTVAGQALLIAYRGDGSVLWRLPFERTPGAPPVWNEPALTFWWPGHFRDRDRIDLFVNTRRGPMHSDVGQLVNGRTGRILWRREKAVMPGEFSWGYAGLPPGIADMNGDGLDEITSLYPVCFWTADGRTGELRVGKDLASQKVVPAWAAYGEAMVHDFTGDGRPDVLLDSQYILALLDASGKPIWSGSGKTAFSTNPGQTTLVKHALCDIDGDGTLELASSGYADGTRVIDPREGRMLWSLVGPAPTCLRVVAADIDGRPGDEILYSAGDTLIVVGGNRTGGRELWRWKATANLSMPAIADTDGDGRAEIVVQSANGVVHCLDSGG